MFVTIETCTFCDMNVVIGSVSTYARGGAGVGHVMRVIYWLFSSNKLQLSVMQRCTVSPSIPFVHACPAVYSYHEASPTCPIFRLIECSADVYSEGVFDRKSKD